VSMPGDFASVALEAGLAKFACDYPEVALEIDLSPRRVDLIGENFDLAIRMGELQDDAQLAARRLATFSTGLYAAPALVREHGEPLVPAALQTMPALMILARSGDAQPWQLLPRAEDGTVARADDPRGLRLLPERRTLANSPGLLLRLASLGAGVAAATDFFAEPYVARGELVPVLRGWGTADVPAWAVFPGRRLMPAKTRAFIDMLQASLRPCRDDRPAAPETPANRFKVD